jgi:protein-S-isoprenylcysteine O-methyltransferase Ste14
VSLGYFLFCYFVRDGVPAAGADVAGPVVVDVGLFTMFALHHSAFARGAVKAGVRAFVPHYLERSLYTWVSSAIFIGVCAWWRPVPGLLYQLTGPWAMAGYAVQGVGIVLTARGARALDVLDLAGVRPFLHARDGTTPRHVPLETRGVYAIVRHPVYLAWTLVVFGTPVLTGTRLVFAAVSTAYLALAIPFEERGLVETFGRDYDSYRQRVRWRMIPGLY